MNCVEKLLEANSFLLSKHFWINQTTPGRKIVMKKVILQPREPKGRNIIRYKKQLLKHRPGFKPSLDPEYICIATFYAPRATLLKKGRDRYSSRI